MIGIAGSEIGFQETELALPPPIESSQVKAWRRARLIHVSSSLRKE
jgi:hypothetical protein